MVTEELAQESFECSHCESTGQVSFSSYERQEPGDNTRTNVIVKNLPKGIGENGIKNLFLTVGKPVTIDYYANYNSALVTFDTIGRAELAVRDLHGKPPYYLKVSIKSSVFQSAPQSNHIKEHHSQEDHEVWNFAEEKPNNEAEVEVEDNSVTHNESVNGIRNILKNLDYDPSIRFRQTKLDSKTEFQCISLGRGYIYRGETDSFVGGLQKLELNSQKSKAKEKMRFYCENCQALTAKICGRCSASYCSKTCLSESTVDHKTCDDSSEGAVKQSKCSESKSDEISDPQEIPLNSGCTVIMSTYLTMQTVYVRRIDDPWEEKFARLCNDVAADAFMGERVENIPKAGDIVIAKYYEDLSYYRARVISAEGEKVKVLFIDFGNNQETDLDDLKPLSNKLKSMPAFAVKVNLKDVSNESTHDSVNYFNKLTVERSPLTLNLDPETDTVILLNEKTVVNKIVMEHALPSWKREGYVFSMSGEVLCLDSLEKDTLEIESTYNLILSHFDEGHYMEFGVFWVTKADSDVYFHAKTQMQMRMREYCENLKNDYYLPRVNELCLAKEDGEWYRCVNLETNKTTCYLYFLDVGHCAMIETKNIRKIVDDFIEIPSLAICCTLQDDPKLKGNKELQSVAVKYLKESVGRTIESAVVLSFSASAYCLSIPEINEPCHEGNIIKNCAETM